MTENDFKTDPDGLFEHNRLKSNIFTFWVTYSHHRLTKDRKLLHNVQSLHAHAHWKDIAASIR